MIAFSGLGFLGYVVFFGTFFGAVYLLDAVFGPGFARQNPGVAAGCSWVVGSLLCWPVGRRLNKGLPIRVFDESWAQRGRTSAHSVFFVRLEFAGVAALPIHVLIAVLGFGWFEKR